MRIRLDYRALEPICRHLHIAAVAFLFAWVSTFICTAADAPDLNRLKAHFEYDRSLPFDVREVSVTDRGKAVVHDLSYRSPCGGMVPAYLVVPKGNGPFAAVLYGHWMMHSSPLMNRKEFLEEAVLLARSGVVSLLIDSPMVRPGFVDEKDMLQSAAQASEASRQQVIDFRRGLDLLLARPDVDSSRIAYVGHSFDAHVGAILAAVEKRIKLFVLMSGSYADQENTFDSKDSTVLAIRKQVGDKKIRAYFNTYAWDDPVYYLPFSSPSTVFLQFGNRDHPRSQDLLAYQRFGNPKRVEFYDAGHALNAAATKDRVLWLATLLDLRDIDTADLSEIPELR
jgi:dienelactone hydrolase